MKVIIKKFIMLLFTFLLISCNNINSNSKKNQRFLNYNELVTVLTTNNYKYIEQVLKNYNVEVNEVQSGLTILDKYQYYLKNDVLNLLKNYGAKYCRELRNQKCKNLNDSERIKFIIKHNPKLNDLYYLKKIKKNNNISEFLIKGITHQNKYFIKIILNNFKIAINNINIKIDKISEPPTFRKKSIITTQYTTISKISLLDYSIMVKNKEIISLLRQHGAKRSCEILKTKCKPLSPEIEKILNGDK